MRRGKRVGAAKFKRIFDSLLTPISNGELRLLTLFLLFNVVGNIPYYIYERFYGTTVRNTVWFLVIALCLSCTLAYVETAIAYALRRFGTIRSVYVVLISVLYNVFILVDYFCLFRFQTCFLHPFFDAVWRTNFSETLQFLQTYLTVGIVVSLCIGLVGFNAIVVLLARIIARIRGIRYFTLLFGVLGLGCWGYMVGWFALYHSSTHVHLCTSPTRFAYFYGKALYQKRGIRSLRTVCEKIDVAQTFSDRPNVVVVIGESASVYHSQLYGYGLPTTPIVKRLEEQGELIAFDDAVSVADYTFRVMESVYSLDSMCTAFATTPLFPAVYKNCGYRTYSYDNSYYVGMDNTFLSDAELSRLLFDYRNDYGYAHDGDLINTIEVVPHGALYVVHLWGQHYLYESRYPESWKIFDPDQYDKERWNERQRELIAQYDDATRYNDYVLGQIMEKFKGTDCVLIYFSDHGQEVFELRNFNGHGAAAQSSDLRYQIRVPLFIWMSQGYRKNHPDVYRRALENRHTRITTDDVSHTILGLGGMRTEWYQPTRDFLQPSYIKTKRRIVLNSIDYDEYVSKR